MAISYTLKEERALRKALSAGSPLHCPRCGEPVTETPVLPSPQVAYVRDRVLLQCSSCGARAAVDRR